MMTADFSARFCTKVVGDAYGSSGNQAYWYGQPGNFLVTNPQVNHIPSYDTTDLVMGVRGNFFEHCIKTGVLVQPETSPVSLAA